MPEYQAETGDGQVRNVREAMHLCLWQSFLIEYPFPISQPDQPL